MEKPYPSLSYASLFSGSMEERYDMETSESAKAACIWCDWFLASDIIPTHIVLSPLTALLSSKFAASVILLNIGKQSSTRKSVFAAFRIWVAETRQGGWRCCSSAKNMPGSRKAPKKKFFWFLRPSRDLNLSLHTARFLSLEIERTRIFIVLVAVGCRSWNPSIVDATENFR